METAAIFIFVAVVFAAVSVPRQKHLIPEVSSLEADEALDGLRKQIKAHADELSELGFRYCGVYASNTGRNVKEQMALFVHTGSEVEFKIRLVRTGLGLEMAFIDFASSLAPHGRLELGNMNQPEFAYPPPDLFLMTVLGEKSLEELYEAHVGHLTVLAREGFTPRPLSDEYGAQRAMDRRIHAYEYQVMRGRMTRRADGSYRQKLSLGVFTTIAQAFIAVSPLGVFALGKRTEAGRAMALRRAAALAKRMPEQWRMKPERV